MRILHLVPGSGGTFYCQNCLRDRALVRALRRHGHDVIMAPLYLPMYGGDAATDTDAPIFFGGINVYLREKVPLFRHFPGWAGRLLDAPWMLRRASKKEGSTSAADLGPMTLSMLNGRDGNQGREFDRLLEWVSGQDRPDIVHVSNALLLGLAPGLREATGAAVVCSLQDEEPWVDAMRPPFDRLVWEAMSRLAESVDAFAATSRWYADRMIGRMRLDPARVRVVPPGVELSSGGAPPPVPLLPPTLGYLSRINPSLGFDTLLEAFLILRREPSFATLRLSATGGVTPADRPYVAGVKRMLEERRLMGAVDINESFHSVPGDEFFGDITVLASPTPGGEAFGMQLLEAMSRGIPVVQPRVGSYPEILRAGGGVLYAPNDAEGLAAALRELFADTKRITELGREAHAAVLAHFSMDRMVRDTLELYASVRPEAAP